MRRTVWTSVIVLGLLGVHCNRRNAAARSGVPSTTPCSRGLPAPAVSGGLSLNAALAARRSVRAFASRPLSSRELGQLLWAAQGVTAAHGARSAPSAGAIYPLTVYVADASALWRYSPERHLLERARAGDSRRKLAEAAFDQSFVAQAPAVVIIVARPSLTARRYGALADRFVALEAGHAAQNLLLAAVALGLGATPVGAFDAARVRQAAGLADTAVPLELIPVGAPK